MKDHPKDESTEETPQIETKDLYQSQGSSEQLAAAEKQAELKPSQDKPQPPTPESQQQPEPKAVQPSESAPPQPESQQQAPVAPESKPGRQSESQSTSAPPQPESQQQAPESDPVLSPGESGLPTVGVETPDDVQPLIRYGDVLLSDITRLVLHIGSGGDLGTLEISIQDELIVGRSVEGQPYVPDIDLSPFNAYQTGVSRYHLKIARQGDTLYVTDLGSQNGTFLNGVRLYPNQARVLRDDDELLLGRMPITVCLVGAEPSEF